MARRRFGSIETLVEGEKYRIHWKANRNGAGVKVKESETIYGTLEDAEVELLRKELEHTTGKRRRNLTWSQFWEAVVVPSMDDLSERTRADYTWLWDAQLKQRIGDCKVSDTNFSMCDRVIGSIEAPSVQRYTARLWKKMCNMAVRKEMLDRCPIDRGIKYKPLMRRKKNIIEASEVLDFIGAIGNPRYRYLAICELAGGMSHEEACALLGSDWRREDGGYAVATVSKAITNVNGTKVLKGTKNQFRERDVWLAEPFASAILDYVEGVDGPVVPSNAPRGSEINESWYANPRYISNNWRKWCDNHGIQFIRFGEMRTNYSTLHGEAGTPDSLVSLSMGHSDGTTRGRNYQVSTKRGLQLVADSLAEYIVSETPRCAMVALKD